jgi:hypothetical protein
MDDVETADMRCKGGITLAAEGLGSESVSAETEPVRDVNRESKRWV